MKLFNKIQGKFAAALLFITALLSLAGCKKDFLDRSPQGQYTQDTYPFPGGSGPFDQYIFSAYDQLRSYDVSVMPFVAAVSIRSDDADKGSTPADGPDALQMDNFTL
ncbi:MAG TPA: RagB/SusD family nutrient uptake outer membrane protein, partial [Sphingobacteriaceae bacterium]